MVDGFPYKEEVGGSSPSVPTSGLPAQVLDPIRDLKFEKFSLYAES